MRDGERGKKRKEMEMEDEFQKSKKVQQVAAFVEASLNVV